MRDITLAPNSSAKSAPRFHFGRGYVEAASPSFQMLLTPTGAAGTF